VAVIGSHSRGTAALARVARGSQTQFAGGPGRRLVIGRFNPQFTVIAGHSGFASLRKIRSLAVADQVVHVGDDDFEAQVLQSDTPVLVDFWAEWCGPCKMIGPIVDEIATSHAGKVKVVKINIDNNPKVPRQYAVRGIPTLMMFKNGAVHSTQVGAVGKAQLASFVDKAVA
jgi:thioredoxin 1